MKTYIVEIPVEQTNEEADGANAAYQIDGETFVSKKQVRETLNKLDIDKLYFFSIPEFVAYVNDGNDNFNQSYLSHVKIDINE